MCTGYHRPTLVWCPRLTGLVPLPDVYIRRGGKGPGCGRVITPDFNDCVPVTQGRAGAGYCNTVNDSFRGHGPGPDSRTSCRTVAKGRSAVVNVRLDTESKEVGILPCLLSLLRWYVKDPSDYGIYAWWTIYQSRVILDHDRIS